jgi:hypothetical protein
MALASSLAWMRKSLGERMFGLGADGEPVGASLELLQPRARERLEPRVARRARCAGAGVGECELARLTGDEAARERELREAQRLFLEIGAPIRAEQVAKDLGS